METSTWIKVFGGNILVTGKAHSLKNKTGTERVGECGDRPGDTSVYTKFGNMWNVLMGSIFKSMMDELIRDIVSHSISVW